MAERPDTVALVTGASSGIGFALARCFAEDGHAVVMASHNPEKLEAAAGELREVAEAPIETIVADLSAADGARRLYESAQALWGTPDYLVNNAGLGVHGEFATETDLEEELSLIQLNVTSVVTLTKLFAADMTSRRSGRILITSSLAGVAPMPKMAIYSATKAFEYAFAEAIANELAPYDVTVTALLPAETETGFFQRADMLDTGIGIGGKADPASVARAGYQAMMKGSDHVYAPFSAQLRAALVAVTPQRWVTRIARAD